MAKANVSDTPRLSSMKYRVVKPLGTGAGSTILEISDKTGGGKRYALKVVKRQDEDDDVYVEQAKVEYEAAQKLNHPVIAKIYDMRLKRSWFKLSGVELLMEYVEGKTLDEIEAPEMGQIVLMFCQVASAMNHMHRRGVFHGDLKPSNIMLSKNGQVKLIDFGTAWIRGKEKNRAGGTPQYVAPEQVTEKTVDIKTDIYNFGATMYRMFTGRFANQGLPKAGESGARKLVAPTQINPKLPTALNDLILSCLEYSPERRPNSMFEIGQQLSGVAKSIGLEEVDLKGAEEDE
jgi:serine/threonine-protein kinase